jgi:O-succinylbenzoic acid--CoA ligase
MNYPYSTIRINGRLVSLESIVNETALSQSPFENHTFSFLSAWLSGQKTFDLQTSGSTGEPKTITASREQMVSSARLTEQTLQLSKSDQALICIDTKYIGGRMMLVRCLTTGMRILAVDPVANPLTKIPVDQCVNFAAFVPLQVQSILGSKHPHLLDTLDKVIIGGAPLDEKVIQQLRESLCRCYATYGMTETLSHVALRVLNGKDKQPYFEALSGITFRVDQRGCLIIDVPYLSEPVITNDLAELINERQFVWLGRWDNVINTGGVKVIPEKLEATLSASFSKAGMNNRFFIHGVDDPKFGHRIVLFIEGTGLTERLLSPFFTDLAASLPPFEIPKEVRTVSSFATTDTGKINRIKTLLLPAQVFSL